MIGKPGKFHGQQNRIISIVKLSVFISILIAIVITIRVFEVDRYLEKDRLKNWISGFGSLAPIAYIILFSINWCCSYSHYFIHPCYL
ncbi:MAG: hypothetical protein HY578_02385 [Nitrospinae bacterium]|nr:hypothetical protein [Nitrospinota bacterium]